MKPQNQTFLAAIIALTMISGFLGVMVVDQYVDHPGEEVIVFTSDSNMEWGELDNSLFEDSPQPHVPASYRQLSGVWTQNNITPVYNGNDTWIGNVIGFGAVAGGLEYVYLPIQIPELETFIISSISVNMSMPGDTDQTTYIWITSTDNPTVTNPYGDQTHTQQIDGIPVSGDDYVNRTFDIELVQALQIYANAQDNTYHELVFYIVEGNNDGLTGYALEFTLTITGTMVSTWTIQDNINLAIGISIGVNIFVIIFMTDAIDFGEVSRKDLHKGGAERPKRKSRR